MANYTKLYYGIELDPKEVVAFTVNKNAKRRAVSGKKVISNSEKPDDGITENDEIEYPEEIKPWMQRLSEVLQNMDSYGFERLAQRVLRECGFT